MKYILLVVCIFVLFTSCKKSSNSKPGKIDTAASHGLDVYVAGNCFVSQNKWVGGYWKNGIFQNLTDTNVDSGVYGIEIDGTDIYAFGFSVPPGKTLTAATYWKNGVIHILPDDGNTSAANAITIIGNDVYVGGSVVSADGSMTIATYWKNGVRHSIPNPPGTWSSSITAIAITGSDVYFGGTTGGNVLPGYWKNDVFTILSQSNSFAEIAGAAVNGNDLYFSGTVRMNGKWDIATYWKNGVATQLEPDTTNSDVSAIVVNGQDIYMGGAILNRNGYSKAYYWKNGISTKVDEQASINALAINGSDIYAAGIFYVVDQTTMNAVYWINGKRILLKNPYNGYSYASGISLLKH